jgi:hypothetical protein
MDTGQMMLLKAIENTISEKSLVSSVTPEEISRFGSGWPVWVFIRLKNNYSVEKMELLYQLNILDISQEELHDLCETVGFKPSSEKSVEDFWKHLEKFNELLKVKY